MKTRLAVVVTVAVAVTVSSIAIMCMGSEWEFTPFSRENPGCGGTARTKYVYQDIKELEDQVKELKEIIKQERRIFSLPDPVKGGAYFLSINGQDFLLKSSDGKSWSVGGSSF